MFLDRLDERNAMVKSVSHFDNFTKWTFFIVNKSENHFGCSCPAFKEMGISHFLVSISKRSSHHFDIHESDTISRSVGQGRGIRESGKEGSTSTIGRRGA